MTSAQWTLIASGLLLLLATAVFETAKAGVARVSVPRAEKMLDDEVSGARTLLTLVTEAPQTVAALALLTTLLRAAVVAVCIAVGLGSLSTVTGVVTGTAVAVLALYVVADVVPARVIGAHPERAAVKLAGVVRIPAVAVGPPARMIARLGAGVVSDDDDDPSEALTEEHLRDLIDVAASDDRLSASRYAMLTAVLDLDDTIVREIMVPRPDMVSVSATATRDEVIAVILEAGHSRLPVYGADRDEIEGVLYAKDMLALLHTNETRPWIELLRTPLVVPELKSVEGLLHELQAQQVHLAVVVDEYGATVGLVTIEDILEELVGEIVDEYDQAVTLVEVLDDHHWRVDARLSVDDLAVLVDARLPDDEWDTVGGLLFGMLGHIATPGEQIAVDGVRLTAEQVRGRRIATVLVERRPPNHEEQP